MWTNEKPTEEGWYFLRWNWWPKEFSECCFVYEDKDDCQFYVERIQSTGRIPIDRFSAALWMKIDIPGIETAEDN